MHKGFVILLLSHWFNAHDTYIIRTLITGNIKSNDSTYNRNNTKKIVVIIQIIIMTVIILIIIVFLIIIKIIIIIIIRKFYLHKNTYKTKNTQ